MSTKTWNNLTKYLQTFLTSHLDENDVGTVMEAWADEKSAVLKLVGASGSTRKKKDPAAPKKGRSNYIWFCGDVRAKLKEDNPEMSVTDLSKKMGTMWQELPAKKKKKYDKMASDDKERYKQEMENYTPPEVDEEETTTKRGGKKANTGPKKPLASYMFFSKDVRPQVKEDNPEMKFGDIAREVSRRWKEISDDDKTQFEDLAAKDRVRYEEECKEAGIEVKAKKEPAKKEPAKKAPAKKAPAKKAPAKKKAAPVVEEVLEESDESEEEVEVEVEKSPPKKKSSRKKPTGYILFCQENRTAVKEDNPNWKVPQVTKELSKRWKDLDEDERDEFNDRALTGETVTK